MLKLHQMFDNAKIPENALKTVKVLKDAGHQCYLVGGCVRDLLLDKTPDEWDITTSAEPKVVSKLFKKVVPTGIKYGTVTVLSGGQKFEVTTFRKDEKYCDGRHPENVKFTKKLDEDLSRRDFTINAMAYDPSSSEFVDLFHGKEDLGKKLIKAVGDPIERFSEDGLRPIRACRFAAQLEFAIEEETFSAMSKVLKTIKKVAAERVHDEIVKILKCKKPSVGFDFMQKAGILKLFISELVDLMGVEQPKEFHKYDVYWHSLYAADAAPAGNLIVRLAALFHDIAKPACKEGDHFYNHDKIGAAMAQKILKRLRFSNEIIESVGNLIANHMFNYEKGWGGPAVRRFIKRVGLSNIDDLFALRTADTNAMEREIDNTYLDDLKRRIEKAVEEENALNVSDLKISGRDVMKELKIKPSPRVGEVLKDLLEKVLEDPSLNSRKKLLELLRAYK